MVFIVSPVVPRLPGSFGAVRAHGVHTGVDLYCPLGSSVLALESGVVVVGLTGCQAVTANGPPAAGADTSTFWNETLAVMVQGASGVVVYAEVAPSSVAVCVGDSVSRGDLLGLVSVAVLKHNNGDAPLRAHVMPQHALVVGHWAAPSGDPAGPHSCPAFGRAGSADVRAGGVRRQTIRGPGGRKAGLEVVEGVGGGLGDGRESRGRGDEPMSEPRPSF